MQSLYKEYIHIQTMDLIIEIVLAYKITPTGLVAVIRLLHCTRKQIGLRAEFDDKFNSLIIPLFSAEVSTFI